MITAKRLPDWRPRLTAALLVHPATPHIWGNNDCWEGLIVPCVLAMTGVDIGEPYRGRYSDQAGAEALLQAEGFATVADKIASLFPEIHPSRLHVGDIAALDSSDGSVGLGMVNGATITVLGERGQGSVRLTRALRGFRVG